MKGNYKDFVADQVARGLMSAPRNQFVNPNEETRVNMQELGPYGWQPPNAHASPAQSEFIKSGNVVLRKNPDGTLSEAFTPPEAPKRVVIKNIGGDIIALDPVTAEEIKRYAAPKKKSESAMAAYRAGIKPWIEAASQGDWELADKIRAATDMATGIATPTATNAPAIRRYNPQTRTFE
jgi:hypothetical protein